MNRSILISILFFCCLPLFPQSAITIEDCYKKAKENYPLIRQFNLIEKSEEYNLENANKGYLPQLMFSSKATYQSDVTKIPIDLSRLGINDFKIPQQSQDQYGVTLDLNQTIWDGGEIKSQKDIIRSKAEVEKKKVEVTLYSINARVNQIYFGILLSDAQLHQNKLLKEYLDNSYNKVASYVRNGIANQSDLNAIKVDMLKAEQNRIEYTSTKKAYIAMLSKLIGDSLSINTLFVRPSLVKPSLSGINRVELELYEAQINDNEQQLKNINAGLYPKLSLFATGGYGKPGLDMLENKFSPYYIAGVRLSWNIGNFYSAKNKRRVIQNNKDFIINQRNAFLFDVDIDVAQKNEVVEKYFDQLEYDDEIINLKKSIREASEAKIAGGTISGTDLMQDVNAEQSAIQDKLLHEIRLLLAIYDLKYTTNDDIANNNN